MAGRTAAERRGGSEAASKGEGWFLMRHLWGRRGLPRLKRKFLIIFHFLYIYYRTLPNRGRSPRDNGGSPEAAAAFLVVMPVAVVDAPPHGVTRRRKNVGATGGWRGTAGRGERSGLGEWGLNSRLSVVVVKF